MDFSEALTAAKSGSKITRAGWNGPGQWVALSPGPYLLIRNAQGVFVPWLASQGDLLAEDWAEAGQ